MATGTKQMTVLQLTVLTGISMPGSGIPRLAFNRSTGVEAVSAVGELLMITANPLSLGDTDGQWSGQRRAV